MSNLNQIKAFLKSDRTPDVLLAIGLTLIVVTAFYAVVVSA